MEAPQAIERLLEIASRRGEMRVERNRDHVGPREHLFAILGLRSLYFLLARAVRSLVYLQTGLAFVLVFIGGKMLAKVRELAKGASAAQSGLARALRAFLNEHGHLS